SKLSQGFIVESQSISAKAAFVIEQGASNEGRDIFFRERFEHEHAGTRQQWRNNFERRIFGCRTNQGDQAALDMRQDRILLSTVPPVNLVNEKRRPLAFDLKCPPRRVDRITQFCNSRAYRADRVEHST